MAAKFEFEERNNIKTSRLDVFSLLKISDLQPYF